METAGKIFGYLFLIIAYAALAGGLYFIFYHTWFWCQAEVAEGTVVGWKEMQSYNERRNRPNLSIKRARATVVSFRTATGEEIVFATNWGSSFKVYNQGSKVTVLYDPDKPGKAKIRGFMSLYLGPLLLLVFGGGFWVAGQLVRFFFR